MRIKKGFSLIELLAVIAIVTLSAGVLMPAINNQRAIARQTLCQSNLKQWAVIFRSYTQENDGRFYQAWYSSNQTPVPLDHRWMNCVRPYYDNPKILFCPQAVTPRATGNSVPGPGISSLAATKSTEHGEDLQTMT